MQIELVLVLRILNGTDSFSHRSHMSVTVVMPAKAGIQRIGQQAESSWIPAFARMTKKCSAGENVSEDKAGHGHGQ